MIENLLGGGGGGGTVDTIQAGTGISVDATDPANPIITNTSLNTDEVAKVSSNDTTAGYLNGKLVAGTGIGLTENNNGGNETLGISVSNLDASAITTGTVATARLGSGTANSTTYLAGDQTYKAAVTSVNGSTGAVTVAAGDTTYTITTQDAENSTADRDAISFVIPANSMADFDLLKLTIMVQSLNNSGSTAFYYHRWKVNGTLIGSDFTTTYSTSATVYRNIMDFYIWRSGNDLVMTSTTPIGATTFRGFASRQTPTEVDTITTTQPTFSSNITLAIRHKWDVANASTYGRILNARVVKYSGQTT